jgi:hypothetical protein
LQNLCNASLSEVGHCIPCLTKSANPGGEPGFELRLNSNLKSVYPSHGQLH